MAKLEVNSTTTNWTLSETATCSDEGGALLFSATFLLEARSQGPSSPSSESLRLSLSAAPGSRVLATMREFISQSPAYGACTVHTFILLRFGCTEPHGPPIPILNTVKTPRRAPMTMIRAPGGRLGQALGFWLLLVGGGGGGRHGDCGPENQAQKAHGLLGFLCGGAVVYSTPDVPAH